MNGDVAKERERLTQRSFIERVGQDVRATELLTLFFEERCQDQRNCVYCGLIPNAKVAQSLQSDCWDLSIGGGTPGSVEYWKDGKKEVRYLRFGDDSGVEPLLIYREFHGVRDGYFELGEEFRLFHRLYHDRKRDCFVKIDDAGNEHLVATIEPSRVRVRLLELRQFLAIKEMHLAVFFDCVAESRLALSELGLTEGLAADSKGDTMTYSLAYGDYGGLGDRFAFSRLLGKRLITPLPKEKSGFWGFGEEQPKQHSDFIIGIDEGGKELLHTSDPNQLANYFGANPGAPHYLTPVFFRKTVLDKYYQQPSRYSVEAGYLRCGGLWGMTMDNHHEGTVAAWLGDLGRDLPYDEQLHWRSYNIAPSGGVSEVFFKQQILAIATDSDQPEHVFKQAYDVKSLSAVKLGWHVLLPLERADDHYLSSLHVPAGNEQKDFDELILAMAKLLVDSLNEKELNKLIAGPERMELKGSISRLERVLLDRQVKDSTQHVKFLRDLQNLRSAGTAHRKGSNYRRIATELGIDSQSLQSVFTGVLVKGVEFLRFIAALVESDLLSQNWKPVSAPSSAPTSAEGTQ